MSEREWVATLMGIGAVLEAVGVSVIGVEIRRTSKAVRALNRAMVKAREQPTSTAFPLGDLVMGIVRFLDDTTSGRPMRVVGFVCLLEGIAVTVVANLWAVLGLR